MLRKIILLTLIVCVLSEESKRKGRDSYLDALKESHASVKEIKNRNDRIETPGKDYGAPVHPEPQYPPSNQYGPPNQQYGPPNQQYGPPSPQYGPPTPQYGPPVPHYGPPAHIPSYHPAPAHMDYEVPHMGHAFMGFLDKIHLKLDIFTILKILLKLVIFKKIVSFIALICLLLFIPKFKMDKEEDEGDARSSSHALVDDKINNLTHYVLGAIEIYSAKVNNGSCDIHCQTQRMFQEVDNKYSYQRLLEWYTSEQS